VCATRRMKEYATAPSYKRHREWCEKPVRHRYLAYCSSSESVVGFGGRVAVALPRILALLARAIPLVFLKRSTYVSIATENGSGTDSVLPSLAPRQATR
jgi:hypothetical protein